MSRTRSQPRTEQSSDSASNRGSPHSRSKPPIVAPVSTAFTPGPLFSALFGERGELLGLVLCEQRLRQLGKIAVHDVVDLVEGKTDAVVGDPSLREIISADALGTVARADQGFARGGFLRQLLAPLLVLDARGKHRQRLFLVLVLRAGVLALHHDSGWKMRDSHRRVGLVDMLAAGPRGAESVDAKSEGFSTTSPIALASGSTATVQAEVWMRPWVSVAGTLWTRWPPDSNLSLE